MGHLLDLWQALLVAFGVEEPNSNPMTTKHSHPKPAQHKKPTPVHVIDDEPVEEPLPEVALPPEPVKPAAVALPPPAKSPWDEAEDILRTLADSSASRLGTVHGVDLINAAKKWLATHGRH